MNQSKRVGRTDDENDPHRRDNFTKMKLVLPVGKQKAWELIATPKGIASWHPLRCEGRVAIGEILEYFWREGISESFEVKYLGAKHSAIQLRWRDGAILRFYLHGALTTLTLQVEYPATSQGARNQSAELPYWAFYLANLKSIALGGHDLRNDLPGRTWAKGFID